MALELSKSRTVNILVFSSIFGVIIAAFVLWYSTDQKSRINGASLLAASEKFGVVFSMDQSFYHTDSDARVQSIVTYSQLGLEKPLADIAFSKDALYVIEARNHVVKKCVMPLEQCQAVGIIPGARSAIAMDIAITPDNKHFYVSNSSLHRIDKFSIDGKHLYRVRVDESFNYPNDIVAINNMTIAVADSVNNRVIGIDDVSSGASKIIWELNVDTSRRLDWPSALYFSANGRLWVNNQDLYFDKGEIVVYDALDFSFLDRKNNILREKVYVDYNSEIISLNDGAEPRNFAQLGHKILVGNFSPIELLKIDELSLGTQSFVDGLLQNEFIALSDNRQYWMNIEGISKIGIGMFVVLLLYGAFLEMREGSRKSSRAKRIQRPGTDLDRFMIEPDENGIVWLELKGKNIQNMKTILKVLVVSFPLTLGYLMYSGQGRFELYDVGRSDSSFDIVSRLYANDVSKRSFRLGRRERLFGRCIRKKSFCSFP